MHDDDINIAHYYGADEPEFLTCKYCHRHKGIEWRKIRDKWRLYEYNEPHICDNYKPTIKNKA